MALRVYYKFVRSNKEWRKSSIYFFLTVLLMLTVGYFVRVVISETDSLPQHYFLHLPYVDPKLNDYTIVWSTWYEGRIIKQIIGKEGDILWYDSNESLWINLKEIGVPHSKSSNGRELNAIDFQTIPKGTVFLYSPHDRSFDSRYKELGLVPTTSLQGLVIPLG